MKKLTSIEICAGAGGQALGLEQAGFEHIALVEIDHHACQTLRTNRPNWMVLEGDLKGFNASKYRGQVDLLAGGVPCPPFSIAGKQLGHLDDRDLFPEALRLVKECDPKALLLENVRGLLDPKFESYRIDILNELRKLGYEADWKILQASDFGVSQLRPRAILIAMKKKYFKHFEWPKKTKELPPSVGELLFEEMSLMGWEQAQHWRQQASSIAPTLVGGSKKHGGADLGPTRSKQAWRELAVDGRGLADAPPLVDFIGLPKLTVRMTALIQGFPKEWQFAGRKTPAYRQIGNAFPPPVAKILGKSIANVLKNG